MNEQVRSILDRRQATQSEMIEHSSAMRTLLEDNDPDWVWELERYYAARELLLHQDEELSRMLRELDRSA
jgi:hypothetical protein